MISRDKIAQCFVRFEGTEAEYERKDVNGEYVRLPKYENGGYFVLFDKMANKFRTRQYKLNSNDFAVLMSIMFHLEFNSNIVNISNKTLAEETGIQQSNIGLNLESLEDCNLIRRKGRRIIVNVNYLFKGSILDFYEAYKTYYPEDEGILY
jgi:predicted transcriptional regulator